MRYIIALLATAPNLFIQESQRLFAPIAQDYILSEHSLPHITLAQCYTDDTKTLDALWHSLQNENSALPEPAFLGIGFTKKNHNLWNCSLTVERNPELVILHKQVVELLQEHGLACISPSNELYRPHLTLAKIKQIPAMEPDAALFNETGFRLAIGLSDEHGQFLKQVY